MACGSGPDEKRNQLFFSDFQCISQRLKLFCPPKSANNQAPPRAAH